MLTSVVARQGRVKDRLEEYWGIFFECANGKLENLCDAVEAKAEGGSHKRRDVILSAAFYACSSTPSRP